MTYKNPAERSCFVGCRSCGRCNRRGHDGCPFANTCSGRPDPDGIKIPHPDDLCQCAEGTLRWVTKPGRVIIRKFQSNPFASKVTMEKSSEDERDWNMYLQSKREQFDMDDWDPITFADNSSTSQWLNDTRKGKKVW